jgi:hypothetical protein
MSHDITQTRICVQKMLPHHQLEFNNIHNSGLAPAHAQRLQAAFFTKKLWPKGSKIRIGFTETGNQVPRTNLSGNKNVDPLQKAVEGMSVQQAVKKVVRNRIIPLVDLDIKFVDDPNQANVRVSFDPNGGAWSLVGTDHLHEKNPKNPTINLGWFDVPTTIHEFGHMLGMIHEHQNPKGENIHWNDTKVFEWAKSTQGWSEQTTEQNIINKYDKNSINGSGFDPLSIMLYFFPAYLTTNGVGTKQNLRMSGLDTVWISKMYPKEHGEEVAQIFSSSTFYPDETLERNIAKSKQLASQFGKGGSGMDWKTIGIYVAIVAGLVLLSAFIWWLLKHLKGERKGGRGRYGSNRF